jgi:translation elongation factor EF-G
MINDNEIAPLASILGDLRGSDSDMQIALASRDKVTKVMKDTGDINAYKSEIEATVSSLGAKEAYLLGAAMMSMVLSTRREKTVDPLAVNIRVAEILNLTKATMYETLKKFDEFSEKNADLIITGNYPEYEKKLKEYLAETNINPVLFGAILCMHVF